MYAWGGASEWISGVLTKSGSVLYMSSNNWQVESFRFSFINIESDNSHKDFNWSSLTSSEPDSVTSKPSLGVVAETGSWIDADLTVTKQQGRTDIVFAAKESAVPLQGLGNLADFVNASLELLPKVQKLASHRLAFGGVLFLRVKDAPEGYRLLKQYLPFVDFKEDMSDFFLQVNRRKVCPALGVVNELTKWGCIAYRRLMIAEDGVSQTLDDYYSIRMEFDINNSDSFKEVEGEQLLKYLQDFIGRAQRIAQSGAL